MNDKKVAIMLRVGSEKQDTIQSGEDEKILNLKRSIIKDQKKLTDYEIRKL